jgi:probable rRNA maturation factor
VIYCRNLNSKRRIDLNKIKRAARITLEEEGKSSASVNIIIVSNQKIRAVNRKYLDRDRSTDVIAFPFEADLPGEAGFAPLLGDVMISSDKAFSNAKVFGNTFREELLLYVVHGILHLTGYDDKTRKEERRMRKREDELVSRIKET